jgi:hypothetical protein
VLRVVEQIITSFNWNKHKGDIFLDVAKVFHKAWHQRLLRKLIRIPDRTDKNRSAICKTGLLELLEIGEIRSLERKVTKNTPRFAPVTIRLNYFHNRCIKARTRRRAASTTTLYANDIAIQLQVEEVMTMRKTAVKTFSSAENYPNRLRVR